MEPEGWFIITATETVPAGPLRVIHIVFGTIAPRPPPPNSGGGSRGCFGSLLPKLVKHGSLTISTLLGMIANEAQKVVSHFDCFGLLMKPK